MKNLLIIVPNIGLGGQERVAVDTAAMLQHEYNVTMIIFQREQNSYTPTCKLINLNVPPSYGSLPKIGNALKRVSSLKKLKSELKINISLSIGNTANLANSLSKSSDRVILSIHGYAGIRPDFTRRVANRWVFGRSDSIICVSERMSRDFSSLYPYTRGKVVTLHNPYNYKEIVRQHNKPIDIPIAYPTIVTMGRLEKVKGYSHLMKAFRIVKDALPETRLMFLGDGSRRGELEKQAKALRLDDGVVFMGYQENPHKFLSKCDVYVLSSIHEGFPNALIEAMSCGLPVIATDCLSGPREILNAVYSDEWAREIEYCDYGILVPAFEADDKPDEEKDRVLAEAIVALLGDKDMQRHYRQKSNERAQAFSCQIYKEKLVQILENQC